MMKIIFRTDASLQIGTGHVMRCLTMADALQASGANCHFICREHPGNLIDQIRQRGYTVSALPAGSEDAVPNDPADVEQPGYAAWLGVDWATDAMQTKVAAGETEGDWLITDHYALDARWEQALRSICRNLMVIDDLANRPHDCDVLLDQNFFQDGGKRYNNLIPPSCTRLLGPQYALLRPEFSEARKQLKKKSGDIRFIFIFFGGSDSDNLTGRVLEAISSQELCHLEIDVVLGRNNPHRAEIEQQIAARPRSRLHIEVENMAELMAKADLALGAGGCTTWERLCLGLPSLVITVAENQVPFTRDLHQEGYLTWLGGLDVVSSDDIRQALVKTCQDTGTYRQSLRGKSLVLGDGTAQVANVLTQGIPPEHWRIREASDGDSELYWHWVNDPLVRRNAFRSEYIPWEEHQEWFRRKIHETTTTLLVMDSDIGPIGQVRFEKCGQHFTIDYSIARQFRGLGLGGPMLVKAIGVWRKSHEGSLVGDVKAGNNVSANIFNRLGFVEAPILSSSRMRRFILND
jgi:UDP-2,4-diacetamido-2,4,6-trideoxy-beta-L-altropyranose hydrolase